MNGNAIGNKYCTLVPATGITIRSVHFALFTMFRLVAAYASQRELRQAPALSCKADKHFPTKVGHMGASAPRWLEIAKPQPLDIQSLVSSVVLSRFAVPRIVVFARPVMIQFQ